MAQIIERLKAILEEINNDPHIRELAEAYQWKYGTLTVDDLHHRTLSGSSYKSLYRSSALPVHLLVNSVFKSNI